MAGRASEGLVEDFGESWSTCGYCHSSPRHTSRSRGIWAHQMSPTAYRDLLDRGCRRSGNYIYQPMPEESCCPTYGIRLQLDKFVPSRSQLNVQRRFERYLAGEWEPSAADRVSNGEAHEPAPERTCDALETARATVHQGIFNAVRAVYPGLDVDVKVSAVPAPTAAHGGADVVLTSSIAFAVAVASNKRGNTVSPKEVGAALAAQLALSPELTVRAAPTGNLNFASTAVRASYDAFLQEQKSREVARLKGKNVKGTPHTLQVTHAPARYTEEAYKLYERYQKAVHNESNVSSSGYQRFLVDAPFTRSPTYGIFHQEYRLDGRLIAVGVVDLLPGYFSSVYVFYDPDLRWMGLGTLTALKEIAWAKENASRLGLTHYVLGLYVPSCPKMHYKATFRPFELLDHQTYRWVDGDRATEVIENRRPPPFDPTTPLSAVPSEAQRLVEAKQHVSNALVFVLPFRTTTTFSSLTRMYDAAHKYEDEVARYVRMVGAPVASRVARLLVLRVDDDEDDNEDDGDD